MSDDYTPTSLAEQYRLALESILRWTNQPANATTLDAIHSVAYAALEEK